MKRFERLVPVITAFFAASLAPAIAAPALQMHRAVYDLSLGHTQPVSDVTGVDGRMVGVTGGSLPSVCIISKTTRVCVRAGVTIFDLLRLCRLM